LIEHLFQPANGHWAGLSSFTAPDIEPDIDVGEYRSAVYPFLCIPVIYDMTTTAKEKSV
jgi:hypothetical protein